jgi:hypothetical protein
MTNNINLREIIYFNLLDLDQGTANISQVIETHHKLALKFHPDKNGGNHHSNSVMAEINNVVDVAKCILQTSHCKPCGNNLLSDFIDYISTEHGNFENYYPEFCGIISLSDMYTA